VVGHGDQEGANELVDAYWRRREYLQSRQILVDERTANPLTDEEMEAMAAPATLSYVAQARYELPGLLIHSSVGFQRHDFEYGKMRERGSTGQGECLGEASVPNV